MTRKWLKAKTSPCAHGQRDLFAHTQLRRCSVCGENATNPHPLAHTYAAAFHKAIWRAQKTAPKRRLVLPALGNGIEERAHALLPLNRPC